MDALLFAAGLGTRLRPLTDHVPKALVPVGGVPMLERVARRLIEAGADRLIVNVHHHADQIERFLAEREGFGVEYAISYEPDAPLETGGGLLNAAPLLRNDAPFFLHNTDVVTGADLRSMYRAHLERRPLATLAVNDRDAARFLLFDDDGLVGHLDTRTGVERRVREAAGSVRRLAFCGIHVVEPELPGLLLESGAFGIMEPYLRLSEEGQRILPYHIRDALWLDIGSRSRLEEAERRLAERGEA